MRKGRRGIYSHGEKLLARRNWTNVPLTLLILMTCVAHVVRSGDESALHRLEGGEYAIFTKFFTEEFAGEEIP